VVTVAVVLTISLAVGASTAVLSLVASVVLRPLPFLEPERLVVLSHTTGSGAEVTRAASEEIDFWRRNGSVFSGIASVWATPYARTDSRGQSMRTTAHVVSAEFFSVLGITPTIGRLFQPEEDASGAVPVVVLNQRFWATAFGSNPDVLGTRIRLAGRRTAARDYLVVGVAADQARLHWLPHPDVFLPDVRDSSHWDPGAVKEAIARFGPGIGFDQATAEFTRVIRSGPYPRPTGTGRLTPLHDAEFGDAADRLRVLMVAVTLVLLLASVNVGVLLLVSGAERQVELATRIALGATNRDIVRLLLGEQALLTLLGAVGGTAVAWAGIKTAVSLSPPGVPRIESAQVDGVALAWAVGIALLIGVVVALLPMRLAVKRALSQALAMMPVIGVSRTSRIARDCLFVAQLSLVLALVVGASLALYSFWRLYTVELGFDPNNVVVARVWRGGETTFIPERLREVQASLLRSVQALPEVQTAALAGNVPTGLPSAGIVLPDGQRVFARSNVVTPEYFSVLGIPVLAGRIFDENDDEYALVVSESFASTYLPRGTAVGMTLPASGVNGPRRIVGVVADTWSGPQPVLAGRAQQRASPARSGERVLATYSRLGTDRWLQSEIVVLARPRMPVGQAQDRISEAIRTVDVSATVDTGTLADETAITRVPLRFYAVLLALVAGVALVVTGIGVLAAARQAVGERVREVGLRMALGATPRAVTWLMSRRLLLLFSVAVACGLYLGVLSSTGLRIVLFDLERPNAWILGGAAGLLTMIVSCGVYWPIRRVSLAGPLDTLRTR
jgi:putative ABC transport system permease protein